MKTLGFIAAGIGILLVGYSQGFSDGIKFQHETRLAPPSLYWQGFPKASIVETSMHGYKVHKPDLMQVRVFFEPVAEGAYAETLEVNGEKEYYSVWKP